MSNFSKKDTERLFQVPPDKIEVIYNALDERFRLGHASEADSRLIAERYQVNYPFLLYAGRISPHKNIVRIIEAFAALKGELAKEGQFEDLKLIIIGDEVSKHPDLRRAVVKGRVQNDVRFLGFRADRSAAHLLRQGEDLRVPLAVRRLRPAAAGSHGARHAGGHQQHVVHSRGRGQRRRHGQSGERVRDHESAASRAARPERAREAEGARSGAGEKFSWDDSVRRMLEVYREVANRK